jgi:hypothetical protein
LFFIPPKNLGDPGSSRGTLEHIRVDLTIYIYNCMLYESDTGFFLIYIVYITVTYKQ